MRVNGIGRELEEDGEEFEEEEEDEFTSRKRESYGGKKEDINYDKDPEFADILGDCLDNPEKAQKKVTKFTSFIYFGTKLNEVQALQGCEIKVATF